jgi:RNA polymerase sigma-70 factor (ECF subfamily)
MPNTNTNAIAASFSTEDGTFDRRALFTHMAERHSAYLKRWALVRGTSAADAADLVQAAFERALRTNPPVRNHDELRAWLFVVVRNEFINNHRAAMATTRAWCDAALPAGEAEPMPLWRQIDTEHLTAALSKLSPHLRTTFELRQAGRRLRDIAAMLGVAETTVGVRLHRARKQLRRLILAEHNHQAASARQQLSSRASTSSIAPSDMP